MISKTAIHFLNDHLKRADILLAICILLLWPTTIFSQPNLFDIDINIKTGGISKILCTEDTLKMNWVIPADGSQLYWQSNEFAWGLGYVTIEKKGETRTHRWKGVNKTYSSDAGNVYEYHLPGIKLSVIRSFDSEGNFNEMYRFENTSDSTINLTDIGIYTPLNDNYYGGAEKVLISRCNAHVWMGNHAAYINAERMNGKPPHLGLTVTEGNFTDYELVNIVEDKKWRGWSNTRGTIVLKATGIPLKSNEKTEVKWKLFWHDGWEDFFRKALQSGFVKAEADKYMAQVGDTIQIKFTSESRLKDVACLINNRPFPFRQLNNTILVTYLAKDTGSKTIQLRYGEKNTVAHVLVGIPKKELASKRVAFIVNKQQMKNRLDPRYGAYMVYDNETKSIYADHIPSLPSSTDKDEGAERMGMGALVALWLQQQPLPNKKIEQSVLLYHDFVRNKLQAPDYKVYSQVNYASRHRGYNYPWVATFNVELYRYFKDPRYIKDCYHTMRKFYKEFGYGFYAINVPVKKSIESLREAKLFAEADTLLKDFEAVSKTYIKNGIHYPAHEVSYEQSIVAPATLFFLEMHLLTGNTLYLDEAKKHLVLLEAFNGQQPDYHLNEIAIRHWDGFWFGKRAMWGDTMPHYWSALTGRAFILYYQATGDAQYLKRGIRILDNNLSNFNADGSASCAYIYPGKINNLPGKLYDPFANDQDWAMYYYLELIKQ
jgi:hypothetical protein